MFSNKHKDTAFFSPLNQFSDVCKRALKAVPGINKAFKNFLTDTLLMFALTCILNLRDKLIRQSRYVVADAYFSVSEFANGLEEFGFHLVSRFRSDAAMMYLYTGGRTGKKGRPKEYDGKIDFKNLDMDFSTDTNMSARNVVEFYRTRIQIEFCYRDSKQFTGLCDCQARDIDKLDFAFIASLTSVNVAKVVINMEYPTFSIANFKSLLYNCYLMKRFFAMSGFRPNKSLNAMIFKELSDIAARAA